MANPIISSLEENLQNINIVAKATIPGFSNDRENTGKNREVTIQEFIASYLTNDYQIKKGCIYSKNNVSLNIDCVVLFSNHPKLITPKREVIIAEGVYAAIEIKPDIATLTKKSEFYRGLQQIQSVKRIERKRDKFKNGSQQSEYFDKIPTVIFSFKSQSLEKTINYMIKLYKENLFSADEFPDVIFSMDKGIVFYCPLIRETIFKHFLEETCKDYPDKMFVEIRQTETSILIWFLRIFLNFPKPSFYFSASILNQYLDDPINHNIVFHTLEEYNLVRK